MLVRFRADVLALHPEYMILLAGTNDIARNNGFITVENVMGNLESMVELALLHAIKPVLCTVCPAARFGWYEAAGDPRPSIAKLNGLITAYAQARGIPLVDYHSALATPDGALRPEYAKDSVHPNLEGYKVMEQVLQEVMDGLLAK